MILVVSVTVKSNGHSSKRKTPQRYEDGAVLIYLTQAVDLVIAFLAILSLIIQLTSN